MLLLKNESVFKWIHNNITKWCGWRLVYMLVALTDMLVFIPFNGYEFFKVVTMDDWEGENRTLISILLAHMISSVVLGLCIPGIVKYSTKMATAIIIVERIFSSVLLLFVVTDKQDEAWENGMMWFSIQSMGVSVCMGVWTLVIPSTGRVNEPTMFTVTLKTWLPAVVIAVPSTVVMCAIPAVSADIHIMEQMLYTFGMEALLSAMYFIIVYEEFDKCGDGKTVSGDSNRVDQLLPKNINV